MILIKLSGSEISDCIREGIVKRGAMTTTAITNPNVNINPLKKSSIVFPVFSGDENAKAGREMLKSKVNTKMSETENLIICFVFIISPHLKETKKLRKVRNEIPYKILDKRDYLRECLI